MQNTPIWKPLLIAGVLCLCGLFLYPPSQQLKPGLDLAGGTTLVYQVDVPENRDATNVIEQVIETLKKRIDPNGVRNLIWRRQAGNRIEIQVPLPPSETSNRRKDYTTQLNALVSENIKKRDLDSVLRLDTPHRPAALDRLASGDEPRRQLLEQLAQKHDALLLSTEPYQTLQKKKNELEESIKIAPIKSRVAIRKELHSVQADLISKTRIFVDARKALEQAQLELLATNIDPNELEHVLSLPVAAAVQSENQRLAVNQPRTRQAAIEELVTRHTHRADQIRAVAKAKSLYDEVRGPLDDPNDLIALLRGSGVLEFRIAAPENLPDAQSYRDQLNKRGARTGAGKDFRWFVIDDLESFVEDPKARQSLVENPEQYFTGRGLVGQEYGGEYYVLLANGLTQSLTAAQPDWKLTKSYSLPDDNGFRAVGFELNRTGGQLMGALTGSNRGNPMAIVLDRRVISTPNINDRIQDKGIITGGRGGFNQEEQSYLVRTLNAGSLQGRISENPIYIKTFGPQLGQDNLRHGLSAAMWALVVVAGFMVFYYLFMGVVANFALAANMTIILGVMALFEATFTLPGIAGIVLTIGMAVDANVLIFERIREELVRKADVKTAVRLGYDKALSTIVDANLTTLITCVVLFYTATSEIKGFAVTLMIGILATMFTALFSTRVILDYYLQICKPKKLTSLPTMISAVRRSLEPNIDWVGKRFLFMGISLTLVVTSLIVITQRGRELLDIEFRSGTQVSFELADGKTMLLDQVRQRLTKSANEFNLPQLTGERATVVTVGEVTETGASEFSVSTLETDAADVSEAIKNTFADVIDVQRPVEFTAMGQGHKAPPVNASPVYVIRQPTLGDNINRTEVRSDVSDHIGGVVVVINEMNPPQTIENLTERIGRMRLQPAYEGLGYRSFAVIGMDLVPLDTIDTANRIDSDEPIYRSAAVVVSEDGTNYIDHPETFTESNGLADSEWQLVRDALRRDTSLGSVANFSSQISNTMKQQAIVALTLSLLAVILYIWIRFGSLRYGLAAIVALVHDVTITLGLLALAGLGLLYTSSIGQALLLTDFKINLALVAAIMTIVGYSLNDTIVVFDRVRENRGRLSKVNASIINNSINQTISRTVVTSVTTLLALATLYIFGGDGVHGFAFAMLIGVVVGTYSSIAIAAPLLMVGVATTSDQNKPSGQDKELTAA